MTQLCKEGYRGRKIAPACGGGKTISDAEDLVSENEEVDYFNQTQPQPSERESTMLRNELDLFKQQENTMAKEII